MMHLPTGDVRVPRDIASIRSDVDGVSWRGGDPGVRRALIVGVDYYEHLGPLSGCVNDAKSVRDVLEYNADGTRNFTVHMLTATGPADGVVRAAIWDALRDLFSGEGEIAVFYFSGHGFVTETGGYLCASESQPGDDGLALDEIMAMAARSSARNKMIILDSDQSGLAEIGWVQGSGSEVGDGVTVLATSTWNDDAQDANGSGIFTRYLVEALNGAAADLAGHITPGRVYDHIDHSIGPWDRRPQYTTSVNWYVSLRRTIPPIDLPELRMLGVLFPEPSYIFPLDPGYEPRRFADHLDDPLIPPPDPKKNDVFAILQKYATVNLVRPVDSPDMWHAAMQSKGCELTTLGRHYRELVDNGLI
jgi:hypothetical protein